jgi:thiamine-monophosphate kinase
MREFDLLRHVYAANRDLDPRIEIPPGDDMAMLRLDASRVLVAVDQLIDGRHVDVAATPLDLVGRKAVTRSLSDIAAMAAVPRATLVAVVLPPDFGEDRATALFDAMRDVAARYDCPLIGGDIAFHSAVAGGPPHPLTCSVTVLAEPGPAGAVRRAGAQPGDAIYVTGELGGAMNAGSGGGGGANAGAAHHLTFEPRIAEALALADVLGERLHAMIDISDGLGRDAGHIADASKVTIELDAARLPRRNGCTWQQAIGDGEDYELCFAATGDVPGDIGGAPITRVGTVTGSASPGRCVIVAPDGERRDAADLGWEHHA